MRRDLYITVTNPDFYGRLRENPGLNLIDWTINRHARRGDEVALYVIKPVCAVVAVATLATQPERCGDIKSPWYGHHFVDVHSLRMLKEPVSRDKLLLRLPRWGYPKQMRGSIRVPDEIEPALRMMIRLGLGEDVEAFVEVGEGEFKAAR